jgi:pimeloyl-ACP methyl ester carboxylesterase
MNKKVLKQLALNTLLSVGMVSFAAVCAPTVENDLDEKQFVTKTVQVGDSVINYVASKRRHKKTLILQHGAFMNHITMMGLASLFRGYNVIVPDLQNHGKSVTPHEIDDVESLADIEYNFILKLIETGAIEKDADITYAGWSLGGSIGLEIAIKEKIFNRLILISSSPIWETLPSIPADQFTAVFKNMFTQSLSKDVTPQRLKWIQDNFDSMLSPVPVSENDITAVQKFNVIDKLNSIDMPVLIIAGEQDPLAIPTRQLTLIGSIPNAKLVIIGDESHAMVVGCPEKVYAEMIEYINSLLKKPATV